MAHTWLGAYFAVRLSRHRPDHIHIHHGYFASWVGMVAARLLEIEFSLTLHGSDLLVRGDYLDVKLQNCHFCFTISQFNRRYILYRFPQVDPNKVLVQHLGIDPDFWAPRKAPREKDDFHIVTVGRLHPVKNHGFLLLACRAFKSAGITFHCTIVGEGETRPMLEGLLTGLDLRDRVRLAGSISRSDLPHVYSQADVVVLTSHSEGVPVTLMEAMAMGCLVLAPEITGIPELVKHGRTGFLYKAGSMEDLLIQLQILMHGNHLLSRVRRGARRHVLRHFNNETNLARYSKSFLSRVDNERELKSVLLPLTHENPVLQQI